MAHGRKQIAFDLDTKELERYYPRSHWRSAYKDIKSFMKDNRFEWEQGSVYISKGPMNPLQINALTHKMIAAYPWLNICMRDCVVTNVGQSHELSYLFDKTANLTEN